MESAKMMAAAAMDSSKTCKTESSLLATLNANLDHLVIYSLSLFFLYKSELTVYGVGGEQSKWMAAAAVGAVMTWRGDSGGMWAAMGALANWGLSVGLKILIAQPRPVPAKKSDPGMPSSHSQTLFYAFTFLTFSVSELMGVNHVAYAVGGLAIYFSSYLVTKWEFKEFNLHACMQSWLRVTQRYHTCSQVAVGALLGAVFCVAWLRAWTALVSHVFRSYLWVRVVVVLGAATFWMVLFKITIATFRRRTRKTVVHQ
ncbi:LOW QUALITY PROTEIN: hypothetical protein V2J09_003607 [Rumex salicifolius]